SKWTLRRTAYVAACAAQTSTDLADAASAFEGVEEVGALRLQGGAAAVEHAVDRLLVHRHKQLVDVPCGVVGHAERRPVLAHVVGPRPQSRGADGEAVGRGLRAAP